MTAPASAEHTPTLDILADLYLRLAEAGRRHLRAEAKHHTPAIDTDDEPAA